MGPKFGTSGLRGLVVDLTPALVARYTRAFLAACPHGGGLHVGWDLRASSPQIADSVIAAARAAGLPVVSHGALPTPALALVAMQAGQAAVMVTGSHIPADRNGLKFYVPGGEISKTDEQAILAALAPSGENRTAEQTAADARGPLRISDTALDAYEARYVTAFGPQALAGLRLGIYEHSSVARDVMGGAVRALGAQTVALARSDTFIPVDTEAVDPESRALLAGWARAHGLDAILSTDGDGDRPMLTDARGTLVPGDLLGPLTARLLGARQIVTPVSSNTCVSQMPEFAQVHLTRIGSPFVIAAMEAILAGDLAAKVVGYEANGGFLLGYAAQGVAGALPPLMTRDSLLPLIAPLAAMRAQGGTLADLVAGLPPRFTAADRLQEVATEKSCALIDTLSTSAKARAAFFEDAEDSLDLTDGLRLRFVSGAVVHLRPSGNAPECRCYTEADTPAAAQALLQVYLAKLRARLQ